MDARRLRERIRAALGGILAAVDPEGLVENPQRDLLPPAAAGARLRLTRLRVLLPRTRLSGLDGDALSLWLLSRIPMILITWAVAWTATAHAAKSPHAMASEWERFDWLRYYTIADHGYQPHADDGTSVAFFPGYPLLLYAVHRSVGFALPWVYSGLLVSLVAGALAAAALARIIASEARESGAEDVRAAARDGLTLLVWAPAAVFLAAGYTEAPFLALALWGWLAAGRGRWLRAGLLVAAAASMHINGLFMAAAVAVLFLRARPRGWRAWGRGWPIALPLLPVAAYLAYLHHLTGSWSAWQHAERVGWHRHPTVPWRTLENTWRYGFGRRIYAENAWEYQLEIGVTAIGIGLVVWLAVRRRWPEFTYVSLAVGSLATSHVYMSVNRDMLSWWPLWSALGVRCARSHWLKPVLLTVSAPLMVVIATLFLAGKWAG